MTHGSFLLWVISLLQGVYHQTTAQDGRVRIKCPYSVVIRTRDLSMLTAPR